MKRFWLCCCAFFLASWAWGQELQELQSILAGLEAQAQNLDSLAAEADQRDQILLDLSLKIADYRQKLTDYESERQNESAERKAEIESLRQRSEKLNEQASSWQVKAETWAKNYAGLLRLCERQRNDLQLYQWTTGILAGATLTGLTLLVLDAAGILEF